jgi:hypothetical protein
MAETSSEQTATVQRGEHAVNSFLELIVDAIAEAERAMRKFPQPNYVISKYAEESGEVVKAAIHTAEGRKTMTALRGEMRQAIAMLFRLWAEGDQIHGLRPVCLPLPSRPAKDAAP